MNSNGLQYVSSNIETMTNVILDRPLPPTTLPKFVSTVSDDKSLHCFRYGSRVSVIPCRAIQLGIVMPWCTACFPAIQIKGLIKILRVVVDNLLQPAHQFPWGFGDQTPGDVMLLGALNLRSRMNGLSKEKNFLPSLGLLGHESQFLK